jgi:hypothetical protein
MVVRLGPPRVLGRTISIQPAVQIAEVAVNHRLMITFVWDRKPLDSAGASGWNNYLVERSSAWLDTQVPAGSCSRT